MKDISVYFHIPFCLKKCVYCDFPSWAGADSLMAPVADRMEKEIASYGGRALRVRQVFFGGGTPSVMPPQMLMRLMRALRRALPVAPDAEITMEINPGTLTPALLEALPETGVNRVSMGMQSASPRLLHMMGRIHTFEDVAAGVASLKSRGITNLNLDIMIGFPTQTLQEAEESVQAALALGIPHLSCYSLIPEEGTVLQARLDSGEWRLPEEEEERAMYDLCRERAAQYGLKQYEISNFALPGRECRYNLSVWKCGEYLGIGCAAASHLGRIRWANPRDIDCYLRGDAPDEAFIDDAEARFETVMLGLRLTEGIREDDFIAAHGMTFREAFGDRFKISVKEGLLLFEGGVMRLTKRGMDLQNRVLLNFMPD